MAEWFDLIKSISFSCLQTVQATVSRSVILSFQPQWFNMVGVGNFKIDLSSWIVWLSSSERGAVPFWLRGGNKTTYFGGRGEHVLSFGIIAGRRISSVKAVDSGLASARRWSRSCFSVYVGMTAGCAGRGLPDQGIAPCHRFGLWSEPRDDPGAWWGRLSGDPLNSTSDCCEASGFLHWSLFSFPVFTCHTHKGQWNANLTQLKGLEIWNCKRR